MQPNYFYADLGKRKVFMHGVFSIFQLSGRINKTRHALIFPAILRQYVQETTSPPDLFNPNPSQDSYLTSRGFEEWCDMLGLDACYVRRLVQRDIDNILSA